MGKSQTDKDTPPPVPAPLASQGLTSTVLWRSTITPPRLPVQHVARPRLLGLLEQGLRGPVSLVSAPAGSGKTTLLAKLGATNRTLAVAHACALHILPRPSEDMK